MTVLPLAIQLAPPQTANWPVTLLQYGEEFADNLQVLKLVFEHDVLVAKGVGLGLQNDALVHELAVLFDLLALIQLDSEAAAVVGVFNGAMLDHDDLALPCATGIGAEQTPSAVGDAPVRNLST